MKRVLYIAIAVATMACAKDGAEKDTSTPTPTPEATITIEQTATHTVSDKLIGFNMIYSHTTDSFWSSSSVKTILPQMGSSMLRYPGGAPTNRYHWNNLNGLGWTDNWMPEYDNSGDLAESEYTDVDEYLSICEQTATTPLVGINMGSGLLYERVEDGVAEAEALVTHCGDKVNYYYLDNEPYHSGANYQMSWSEYVEQIKLYAPAIKAINPSAKLIINWEKVQNANLWKIIAEVDEYIDYADVHWYWRNSEATFERWAGEFPTSSQNQWYEEGLTYEEEIAWFNNKRTTDIELITLEWNVGKCLDESSMLTKYEASIIQCEMMMQFINGGLEIAVMWPLFFNSNEDATDNNRYLMDPFNSYEVSPSVDMFTMISEAMGKGRYPSSSDNETIYTVAVSDDTSQEMIIYLHSKNDSEVEINIPAEEYTTHTLELFRADDDERTSGQRVTIAGTTKYSDGCYTFTIPAFSMAKLKLNN